MWRKCLFLLVKIFSWIVKNKQTVAYKLCPLRGHKYVDTQTLHPYVILKTSFPNYLSSGFSLSTRCWAQCHGFAPTQPKNTNEVRHWRWGIRSGSESEFQFIPKVLAEAEVKFFHSKEGKQFLLLWRWKRGGTNCQNQTATQCTKHNPHIKIPSIISVYLKVSEMSRFMIYRPTDWHCNTNVMEYFIDIDPLTHQFLFQVCAKAVMRMSWIRMKANPPTTPT